MARATNDPTQVVLSVRWPRALIERVDTLINRPGASRTSVLLELVEAGLGVYEPPKAVSPPPSEDDPPWAAQIRELHARGLTNAELAEAIGREPGQIRQMLHRLGLPANRRPSTR